MQQPKVTDPVLYTQPAAETPSGGYREHPAVVTSLNDDGTVNLKVFFNMGDVEDRKSVGFGPKLLYASRQEHGFWEWPHPAARDEAETAFNAAAPDAA